MKGRDTTTGEYHTGVLHVPVNERWQIRCRHLLEMRADGARGWGMGATLTMSAGQWAYMSSRVQKSGPRVGTVSSNRPFLLLRTLRKSIETRMDAIS